MLWWSDELETGIYLIDQQHKNIFDKANEIFKLGIDQDKAEIKKVFIFLMDYANNHFYNEEKLMMEMEYENFMEHKKEHNYFVEEIYKLYQSICKKGITEEKLNDLKVLIIDWLVNHINSKDKKFIQAMA